MPCRGCQSRGKPPIVRRPRRGLALFLPPCRVLPAGPAASHPAGEAVSRLPAGFVVSRLPGPAGRLCGVPVCLICRGLPANLLVHLPTSPCSTCRLRRALSVGLAVYCHPGLPCPACRPRRVPPCSACRACRPCRVLPAGLAAAHPAGIVRVRPAGSSRQPALPADSAASCLLASRCRRVLPSRRGRVTSAGLTASRLPVRRALPAGSVRFACLPALPRLACLPALPRPDSGLCHVPPAGSAAPGLLDLLCSANRLCRVLPADALPAGSAAPGLLNLLCSACRLLSVGPAAPCLPAGSVVSRLLVLRPPAAVPCLPAGSAVSRLPALSFPC